MAEKHPEILPAKEYFMQVLDDLCLHVAGVAKRRDMLLHILDVIERSEAGGIMDAIVRGKGVVNTVTDCASEKIALVYNSGWALGFEGGGGDLVILIDAIQSITPHKSGVEIDLDAGEHVYLRFLGWRSNRTSG